MNNAWSPVETNFLLEAYFAMLNSELVGDPYSKIEHNRLVQDQTGRSKGSIEFKFCNVSHILWEKEHAYVNGYKPRSHVQESLREATLAYIHHFRIAREMLPTLETGDTHDSTLDSPVQNQHHLDLLTERSPTMENLASHDPQTLWAFLENLWDRTTGGTDVAARPDHAVNSVWPIANRPPGVEEAMEWLRSDTQIVTRPKLVFLVGGPGAGKSHATAQAVQGLELNLDADDGLAHRIYEFRGQKRDMKIVNDATISKDDDKSPLSRDIDELISQADDAERPTDFMACVNRGILVEELANLDLDSDISGPGEKIIRWLSDSPPNNVPNEWELRDAVSSNFIRSAMLCENGSPRAHLVVVFVDECSLFEVRPKAAVARNSSVSASPYTIQLLADRPSIDENLTPAGDLLVQILKTISQATTSITNPEHPLADPLRANFESLSVPRVRSALLTIARSSELVSASRMTYREIWGLFSRALIGNAANMMSRYELTSFIENNQPSGSDPVANFNRLRRLSELRFSQGLFGAGESVTAAEDFTSDPVLRLMVKVDPIRDALPGNDPLDAERGWTTPISDAFSAHSSEGSPLELLLKHDSKDDLFRAVVTDFDRQIDSAFQNLLEDETTKDSDRLTSITWYSAYLHRLYALAYGISAFRKETSMLIRVNRQSPHLPDPIFLPLQTLLRPQRNPNDSTNESLLPLFDSRTDPITGRQSDPKLAVRVDALELTTQATQGDLTVLSIQKGGKSMGKMTLDFALVREALACIENRAGVTNLVDVAAPRLERIRASRLIPQRLAGAEIRIIDGDGSYQITQTKGQQS